MRKFLVGVLILIFSILSMAVMSESWEGGVELDDKAYIGVVYATIDGEPTFLVVTLGGKLFAINQDGNILWSTQLGLPGQVFQTPIHIYSDNGNFLIVMDDKGNVKVVKLARNSDNVEVFDVNVAPGGEFYNGDIMGSPAGVLVASDPGKDYVFLTAGYVDKVIKGYVLEITSDGATSLVSDSVETETQIYSTPAIRLLPDSASTDATAFVYIASENKIYKLRFEISSVPLGLSVDTNYAEYSPEEKVQSAIAYDKENDKVYVIANGLVSSTLYSLYGEGLERAWSKSIDGLAYPNTSPVIDGEGNIYVATGKSVMKFSKTGTKRWKVVLDDDIYTSPTIGGLEDDGNFYIYVVTAEGKIYKINAEYGTIADSYDLHAGYREYFYSPPISVLSKLVFAGYDEKLHAINISDWKGSSGIWPTFKYLGSRSGSSDYNGPLPKVVVAKAYDVKSDEYVSATIPATYSRNNGDQKKDVFPLTIVANTNDTLCFEVPDKYGENKYSFDDISEIKEDYLKENDTFYIFKSWENIPDEGSQNSTQATFVVDVNLDKIVADFEKAYKVAWVFDLSDQSGVYNEVNATVVAAKENYKITVPSSNDYEFTVWNIITPNGTYTQDDYPGVISYSDFDHSITIEASEPIVLIAPLTKLKGNATLYIQNKVQPGHFTVQLVLNQLKNAKSIVVKLIIPDDLPITINDYELDYATELTMASGYASTDTAWEITPESSVTDKYYLMTSSLSTPSTLSNIATITFDMIASTPVSGLRDGENALYKHFLITVGSEEGGTGKVKINPEYPIMQPIVGDFNGDGKVNLIDFNMFMEHFDSEVGDSNYDVVYDIAPREGFNPPPDYKAGEPNPDGSIDEKDFAIFAVMFGYGEE